MFRKVLIANRGEIAVRIMRTLQPMGIRTVAVYSDADAHAVHVRTADEACRLVGVTAAETYLRSERIIELARAGGVDAIHPGYGFLSENPDFAQMCADAGIAFIGPTPAAMRAVADKIVAKATVQRHGVPIVPGWSAEGDANMDGWKHAARRAGYPVLVKAAAGGGGKGMRRVDREQDLSAAVESAAREARSAFGDGRVFLEKYIDRPRHVEFQIFGDAHGNVVHLFERECSIQRRHQKLVEESPSPALTPALRERMGEAAVAVARAVGYTNAGTVEFMVDASGAFYFLEVNARLQVEHPVTEMVTHEDLVRAQVLVAAGEPLPFSRETLHQQGHAIECRICAEDPAGRFMPSTGTIRAYTEPRSADVRVDSGVERGSEITVHYDPMAAKLICRGATRAEALAKSLWALDRFVILGVTTNIGYLRAVLDHPRFRSGDVHTHFLEEQADELLHSPDVPPEAALVAAWCAQTGSAAALRNGSQVPADDTRHSPWSCAGAWRAF